MKTKAGIEKPLAEWTLQDVKDFCDAEEDAIPCTMCQIFDSGICKSVPSDWVLIERPKFTEQEVQNAKVLNRVLNKGILSIVSMGDTGDIYALLDDDKTFLWLNKNSFPSINRGEAYTYSEIVGDADA